MANKYVREIRPGVPVDVYDVLHTWPTANPALDHLIKKALAAGGRGHKGREEDLVDIVESALRAAELEGADISGMLANIGYEKIDAPHACANVVPANPGHTGPK